VSVPLLKVLEIARPTDKLRCYLAGGGEAARRVRAKLVRGGEVVDENVFVFAEGTCPADVTALVEKAMREVAAAAGARLRILGGVAA
jgi:hypothetical protein